MPERKKNHFMSLGPELGTFANFDQPWTYSIKYNVVSCAARLFNRLGKMKFFFINLLKNGL